MNDKGKVLKMFSEVIEKCSSGNNCKECSIHQICCVLNEFFWELIKNTDSLDIRYLFNEAIRKCDGERALVLKLKYKPEKEED